MTLFEFETKMIIAKHLLEKNYWEGICWNIAKAFDGIPCNYDTYKSCEQKKEFVINFSPTVSLDGHTSGWFLRIDSDTHQQTQDLRFTALLLFEQQILDYKTYLNWE